MLQENSSLKSFFKFFVGMRNQSSRCTSNQNFHYLFTRMYYSWDRRVFRPKNYLAFPGKKNMKKRFQ